MASPSTGAKAYQTPQSSYKRIQINQLTSMTAQTYISRAHSITRAVSVVSYIQAPSCTARREPMSTGLLLCTSLRGRLSSNLLVHASGTRHYLCAEQRITSWWWSTGPRAWTSFPCEVTTYCCAIIGPDI